MWLVLCESADVSALWAYNGLKSRGLEPIEIIDSEALSYSLCWEHSINGKNADIKIVLSDGRTIASSQTTGVLNRLWNIHTKHFRLATSGDRDYATQEFLSFFLSWLYCMPGPILNPPTPHGLSGHFRHASEWAFLAAKSNLPTYKYERNCRELSKDYQNLLVPSSMIASRAVVVGDYVVGKKIPQNIQEGCIKLANLSNAPLLGVEFGLAGDGSLIFGGANPHPDLISGGNELLDKLAVVLRGERK